MPLNATQIKITKTQYVEGRRVGLVSYDLRDYLRDTSFFVDVESDPEVWVQCNSLVGHDAMVWFEKDPDGAIMLIRKIEWREWDSKKKEWFTRDGFPPPKMLTTNRQMVRQ